jgi:hypothetical protein
MESYKYYQFVTTLEIEPFALNAYHFWGVFKNEFIHGSCGEDFDFVIFSDFFEVDDKEKEDLEKIVKKRIEELEKDEL